MRANGPSQPAQLLLDVLDLLHRFGIPYAVVGAFAVSYYGIPRATSDADATIWLNGTGKSVQEVCDLLVANGYKARLSRGDFEEPIQAVIVIKDDYGNQADLLIGVRGMHPDAVTRSVLTSLLDSPIRVMGAEDLIAMKVFAGGHQDVLDVEGILQVSGSAINMDLLRELTGCYGNEASRTLDRLLEEAR